MKETGMDQIGTMTNGVAGENNAAAGGERVTPVVATTTAVLNGSRVTSLATSAAITPRADRRNDFRKPVLHEASLKVLDGEYGGAEYAIQTRDTSMTGVTFLLKQSLSVGQFCELSIPMSGRRVRRKVEVIRSRQLSNGRFEMSVDFRGPEIDPPRVQGNKRRRRR
jgi:hypothetical protein